MARVAVRLVLAALLALISAQAAAPAAFEQPRPADASWHRMARRSVLAAPAHPVRQTRPASVTASAYFFPIHSHNLEFGLFVRPPPFLFQ
jgi:hypothetical protein